MMTNEGEKVRISLLLHPSSSSSDKPSLSVPSNPIAIPSSTRRRGLSAIVNHLLDRRVPSSDSEGDASESEDDEEEKLPAIPFDFLISDRLLRSTIESAARKLGMSLEDAIPVYYFPRRDGPSEDGTSETLPDWITAVASIGGDGSAGSDVCAGGSDGWLRLYEGRGQGSVLQEVGSIKAHSGVIKAVDSEKVRFSKGGAGGSLLASGGMDQTLVTHLIHAQSNHEDEATAMTRQLRLHAIYANGHRTSVNSVRMARGWLASGDWDGGLCLWKVPSPSDDVQEDAPLPLRKKKKKEAAGVVPQSTSDHNALAVHEVAAPTISLKAHSSNISGIAFGYSTTISPSTSSPLPSPPSSLLTSSWDHSIRSWDVETQNVVLTLNGSKVATCLTRCPNSNLVASGHTDYRVRLWDMRVKTGGSGGGEGDGGISDGMLRTSHSAWISAVQWTNDPYILTSASHDGTVKVWDIRSSLPLHTIRAQKKGEKALCLSVAEEGGSVFSGGTDCVVKRFRF